MSAGGGTGSLRDACGELLRKALARGVCGTAEFWHLTPAELCDRFEAARAEDERRLRLLDTLAWLAGQYVAVALNAPRRYPAQPNRVRARATTDAEMRRMLEGLAGAGHGGTLEGPALQTSQRDNVPLESRAGDDGEEVAHGIGD